MRNQIPPPKEAAAAKKKIEAQTRAALYTRVSTEDQAKEGFSLEAQLERLRYYAKAQGWAVADEYVDEGHSGRTTKRPQYARMMSEIDSWDTLLVLKMDRIHRNSRNFMAMMDQLRKQGKQFASATESLDTSTAMGRFVMDIIQRIAQLESDQTGERTHMGLHQKAKTTKGTLGPSSFGIRVSHGRYFANPRELVTVKRIFELYLEGHTLMEIPEILMQERRKARRGFRWDEVTVRNVLRNVALIGIRVWSVYILAAHHRQFIPLNDFVRAQARLDGEGIVVSHIAKGPDYAIKRAEAIRATVEGRPYHAKFKPLEP